MTLNDWPEYEQAVREVAAGFAKKVDEAFLSGYWRLVEDLPLRAFQTALLASARESRFFPSASRVRAAVQDATRAHPEPVSPETAAAMAAGDEYCPDCHDQESGWRETTRDASAVYGPGVVVSAVHRCHCYPLNPIARAKRANSRRLGSAERRRGEDD